MRKCGRWSSAGRPIGRPVEAYEAFGEATRRMGEGQARARRWRRTGHDRLYVTGPEGTALGYLDTITGLSCGVPAGRAEEFHAALAAYRAGTGLGRARPGPQAPAQPGPPPSLGGTGCSPDLIGMHIPPPRQPADGAVRAAAGVPAPRRTGCSTMTRTPISRSRTAAHRSPAPPPRGGHHPRGTGTTWRPTGPGRRPPTSLPSCAPRRPSGVPWPGCSGCAPASALGGWALLGSGSPHATCAG